MQRYFASLFGNEVILKEDDVFHLMKVMRAKNNDKIEIVDENGKAYLARIIQINPLRIVIQEPILKNSELDTKVTLFFALAKSDKIDFVIQKATELGASRIVLFEGKRSIVHFSKDDFVRKYNRYHNIAKEAAEQCHREIIPEICFAPTIKDIESFLAEVNLFAYELDAGKTNDFASIFNKRMNSLSIIVGPEGGFDEKEADYLLSKNFKTISLGKRILRCETAAVYALSVIAFNLEK